MNIFILLTIRTFVLQVDLQRLLLKDLELRSDFLKEVFRLHPPFIGGRRIVEKVSLSVDSLVTALWEG